MRTITFILLILFFCISLYTGLYADDVTYFLGEQICELLLLSIIAINVNGINRIISVALFILCLGELVDEVMGRNTVTMKHDYLFPIIALIVTCYLTWNYLKKK